MAIPTAGDKIRVCIVCVIILVGCSQLSGEDRFGRHIGLIVSPITIHLCSWVGIALEVLESREWLRRRVSEQLLGDNLQPRN